MTLLVDMHTSAYVSIHIHSAASSRAGSRGSRGCINFVREQEAENLISQNKKDIEKAATS
jgi:hypothetical protein